MQAWRAYKPSNKMVLAILKLCSYWLSMLMQLINDIYFDVYRLNKLISIN